MDQKTATLLRSPRRLAGTAVCLVGVVLLVFAILGWSGSARNSAQPADTAAQTAPTEEQPADGAAVQIANQQDGGEQNQPTSGAGTRDGTAVASAPEQQAPAPTVQTQLQINDSFVGNVTIQPGQNHCDVLATAQANGLIHSLDMRWNEIWKTYGIYGINGIGDPNNVNWVYEVNGKSPPVGCSLTKPAAGDEINWKYLK